MECFGKVGGGGGCVALDGLVRECVAFARKARRSAHDSWDAFRPLRRDAWSALARSAGAVAALRLTDSFENALLLHEKQGGAHMTAGMRFDPCDGMHGVLWQGRRGRWLRCA